MATFILTIKDDDGEILFQQAGDSKESMQLAAIAWMKDFAEDYFGEETLHDVLGDNYTPEQAFKYIKKIGETVEDAPQLNIRKAG